MELSVAVSSEGELEGGERSIVSNLTLGRGEYGSRDHLTALDDMKDLIVTRWLREYWVSSYAIGEVALVDSHSLGPLELPKQRRLDILSSCEVKSWNLP